MPPPDDDAGMPIAPPMLDVLGGTCGGNGVTFQWNEIKGATYTLEYWVNNQPPTMVQLPVGTTTYMSPKLSPGMYQANIKAAVNGQETAFSAAKSFTVVHGKQSTYVQMSPADFGMNTNMGVFIGMDGVTLASMADGGNGTDGVDYEFASTPVRVTLDDVANDGLDVRAELPDA